MRSLECFGIGRLVRAQRVVAAMALVAILSVMSSNVHAGITCYGNFFRQTCFIQDDDGQLWITENRRNGFSSTFCDEYPDMPTVANVEIVNASGTDLPLDSGGGAIIIPNGQTVDLPYSPMHLTVDPAALPPLNPGTNLYLQVFEHYSNGMGFEHLYQYSSSSVGASDGLTYQVFSIDAAKNRTGNLFAFLTGQDSTDISVSDGPAILDIVERGGIADISFDGSVDVDDVDVLAAALGQGVVADFYDMNADMAFDYSDISAWLAIAGALNLPSGRPYRPGDADLDGVVNSADLAIMLANLNTDVPDWTPTSPAGSWSKGDFNADGTVNFADVAIWEANLVPEPSTSAMLTLSSLGAIFFARRRTRVKQ